MKTRKRGFTLVELLVVMGIIGVLVALLFPAIGAARAAASQKKALTEVKAIETALRAYYNEYSKFPKPPTGYSWSGDAENGLTGIEVETELVQTFRGFDQNGRNSRRIPFLEISDTSLSGGKFVDPWDQPYKFMCDYNYDNTVHIQFTDTSGNTNLAGRLVAVWSKGPDNSDVSGARADDVVSWQ